MATSPAGRVPASRSPPPPSASGRRRRPVRLRFAGLPALPTGAAAGPGGNGSAARSATSAGA
eukprot:2841663-Pleurochrysis_carterae.AAC.1